MQSPAVAQLPPAEHQPGARSRTTLGVRRGEATPCALVEPGAAGRTPSDGAEYTSVISAVTLKSDFQQETISGPLSEGHAVTVAGQRCIPITGHVSSPAVGTAPATLYVTDSKTPLPVEYKAGNKKATSVTTWSRWGHPVTLTAPSDAIPFASLLG